MPSPLLLAWLISSLPPVVSGPSLAEEAARLDAPIAQVTVFSDRARVRRRASLASRTGVARLRLPDLPGATLLDTVRVRADGGELLRLEVTPVERERLSIEQVDQVLEKVESLTDQIAALDAEHAALEHELGLLAGVHPAPPVPEAERQGRPANGFFPEAWRKVLDFFDERRVSNHGRMEKLALDRRAKLAELTQLQREVQRYDLGAFSDRKLQVAAILDQRGPCAVELEYFVPGARWTPAYDLRFDAAQGRVRVDSHALVSQASGEDWGDVEIVLSTAIPGQSIEVPELLTWTLGEAREFVPVVRPGRVPAVPPAHPLPAPAASVLEAERQTRLALLQRKISQLGLVAQRPAEEQVQEKKLAKERAAPSKTYDFSDVEIQGELARPDASMAPPAPPPEAGARFSARTQSAPTSVSETSAATPGVLSRLVGSLSASKDAVVQVPLSLLEPASWVRPTLTDPRLPAVAAGGLDYQYLSPARVTIPSTAVELRVPLAQDSYPVQAEYAATPALDPTAYLRATVVNAGKRPVLGGPATIFVGKEFVGQGELDTTGPGGKLQFPLGADEDVRLVRRVVPVTKTEGVFSKDDVTTYQVTLEAANYKKRPIRLVLWEPLPKSVHEKVSVKIVSNPPPSGPDADGILTYVLDVPAEKTRKVELSYSITRPSDWKLQQH